MPQARLVQEFNYNSEDYFYSVEAKELIGTDMLLDEASVTSLFGRDIRKIGPLVDVLANLVCRVNLNSALP